jgi:hypothetical protein
MQYAIFEQFLSEVYGKLSYVSIIELVMNLLLESTIT